MSTISLKCNRWQPTTRKCQLYTTVSINKTHTFSSITKLDNFFSSQNPKLKNPPGLHPVSFSETPPIKYHITYSSICFKSKQSSSSRNKPITIISSSITDPFRMTSLQDVDQEDLCGLTRDAFQSREIFYKTNRTSKQRAKNPTLCNHIPLEIRTYFITH